MIVGENTCDGKKKSYETLDTLVDNLYVMDLPRVKSEEGRSVLKAEYERFKQAVETLTGVTITAENLKKGFGIVNDKARRHSQAFEPQKSGPDSHLRTGRSLDEPGLLLRRSRAFHSVDQHDLR